MPADQLPYISTLLIPTFFPFPLSLHYCRHAVCASDSYSGRLGSKLSSARLSSCLGSVPDSTWLKTPLSARLGSAQIGLNAVRFGSVLEALARLDSKLGCIGSKPCSAWLEARLGLAQASDRLGLDSRLETRLGIRFGSRPDSGSGTGSALFGNQLGSKCCSPRCLIRLDSGFT